MVQLSQLKDGVFSFREKFVYWLKKVNPIKTGILMVMVLYCMNLPLAGQKLAAIEKVKQEGLNQEGKEQPLKEALNDIESKYKVSFNYNNDLIKKFKIRKNFNKNKKKPIDEILNDLLGPLSLDFIKIGEKDYVIKPPELNENRVETLKQQTPATEFGGGSPNFIAVNKMNRMGMDLESDTEQEITVSGQVTATETGNPLPGVNVLVQGTSRGTVTDVNGNYSVNVPDENSTLVFSFIGYATQEVAVDGREQIDISIDPDIQALEEVVVIGYGTQERRDITGSISSVSSEEISQVPVSGIEEALQGRAAGVQVTSSSGQPGAPIDINIRGAASFGNTSPLYVIDGVPVFNEVSTMGSGISNPLATLNPGNIESIDILKDASAAAIYGARAANGVVLITTKRGEAGETQMSFDAYWGRQNFGRTIDMMDTEEFIPYSIEADTAAGVAIPAAWQEPLLSQNLQQNTDWQDEAFNPAPMQNYSFSASGGTENARFAFVGNYFDQEGILPANGFKRYSARINTDFRLGENFSFGESIELSRGYWYGKFNPSADVLQELLQSSPTTPVYNEDNLGGYAGPTLEKSGRVNRSNRIAEMNLIQDDLYQNRILGNIYAEYEFFDGLAYRLSLGGDIMYGESKNFTPVYELGNRSNTQASINETRRSENTYLVENTLTYNTTFNDIHDFQVLAGYTQQNSLVRDLSGSVQEFPSNDTRTINAGFGQSNVTGGESEWALQSYIARANYNYDDRYMLMATMRRDGSSRFGEENRWGNFPSFSAGWRISEETFMGNVQFIDDMKLRASWGTVGNQEIPNYAAIATVEPAARYILGRGQTVAPGATFLSLGNSTLKWETTTQTDIGLDLGVLENRLSFTMDYFIKKTEDVLLTLPIPSTSGIRRTNGPVRNAGEIENKGFEFMTTFRKAEGDFQYNISGNISSVKNEVVSLGGGDAIIQQGTADPNFATTYTDVGGEIGAFYGHVMNGLFQSQEEIRQADALDGDESTPYQSGASPGDIRYEDLNGDGQITADDRKVIGSPFPDFYYGLNGNFNYGNFDLSIFFQGVKGNDVYNLLWAGINEGEGDNNATTNMLDRWTPDNRDTNVPRAVTNDPNDNKRPSTRFIEDGSYLRLRNLQVGYNIKPTSGSNFFNNFRIYVAAKNLFTLTDYRSFNPEVGIVSTGEQRTLTKGIDFGTYPIAKVYQLGVQLDF